MTVVLPSLNKLFTLLCLCVILTASAHYTEARAGAPGETAELFNAIESGIRVWDIRGASAAAEQARKFSVSEADKARSLYYSALVEFHKGNYDTAGEYS